MSTYTEDVTDWIADPDLTSEEKLARFQALGPQSSTGPADRHGARFEVFGAGGDWHFRLVTGSDVVLLISEGYPTKDEAVAASVLVAKTASQATVAVA
ncbi:YegP family protein [Nocardioides sp.]|uniref:YegP family protein n=1 Tax=Nocardioides sp. TaxID=35761 RepID=UPI0026163CDE|nr:YegP family protein [Nocardioides sp.]